ncbi:MAG: RES domain-containing protein [Gammaproteobacteria bacterium]|nr:RES domain-containing protein [Gammaproteobacteria bacterium]
MKLSVDDLVFSRLVPSNWHHAVELRFAGSPLWASPTNDARFKAGGTTYPLLHFASDEGTALLEVGVPGPGSSSVKNWKVFCVSVHLDQVVDLRGTAGRDKVSTTVQELTGDWRGYAERTPTTPISSSPPAPTQALGEALYSRTKCQGFLTPSAKNPKFPNLVVFADRVRVDEDALTIEPR